VAGDAPSFASSSVASSFASSSIVSSSFAFVAVHVADHVNVTTTTRKTRRA